MKFIQLDDKWINLSQIKYVRFTQFGVDIHFSAENPTEKIGIIRKEGQILMEALKNFSVNSAAND